MRRHNFSNLKIWAKGLDIVDLVYDLVDELPKAERFNLIGQSIWSACSIPANIAEGSGKRTSKAFSNYLDISLSSSFELETHLTICKRRNFGNIEKSEKLLSELHEEQRMIASFQSKVEAESRKDLPGLLFFAGLSLFSFFFLHFSI